MTRHDEFTVNLASWLDGEAQAPIPAGELDQALASVASRRPRPERLAAYGSHWIDGPFSAGVLHRSWRVSMPALQFWRAVLLLLVALVLIGVSMLVAGGLFERRPEIGQLAFELDGDIYLVDWDGRNPTRVAAGPLGTWAPDRRHLLYEVDDGEGQRIAHIRDASGREVASFTTSSSDLQWSPDSTQLQAWADGSTGIAIYGIDGRRQAFLPVPDGRQRYQESRSAWAPDGRSVTVRFGQYDFWELPVDGSAPGRVATDDPRASREYSLTRDGTRGVFVFTYSLSVANADATGRRELVEWETPGDHFSVWVEHPVWSPDETQVLYAWNRSGGVGNVTTSHSELRIVDVANGDVSTLVAGLPGTITPIGWSSAGEKILLAVSDDDGSGSLWTVNRDGSGITLVVAGTTEGSWEWDRTKPDESPAGVSRSVGPTP